MKRGGRITTLGTPSCWPADMGAPRGTCGTWPMRPGICKRPPGVSERKAILHGLWDGARGHFGENPDYGRTEGELSEATRSRFSRMRLQAWSVAPLTGP